MNYYSLLTNTIVTTLLIFISLTAYAGHNCEHATRVGMNQGCGIDRDATDAVIINKNLVVVETGPCVYQQRVGMDQGCSTSGGTGTSITYTPEDGSLGTCRKSVRAGDPALKGCGAQASGDSMVIPSP